MRVLLVEDERSLADPLVELLKASGIQSDAVYDGQSGLDYALTGIYDVILLDVMLPKMDGFEVLQKIRSEGLATPILMLTALSEVSHKVKGLDFGADDYLGKPFSAEELMARIRALGRRGELPLAPHTVAGGNLTLDAANSLLSTPKGEIGLSLKELSVFSVLLENYPNICSKDLLLDKGWGLEDEADPNNVEVYISFLRKKLRNMESNVTIQTIRGLGYRLEVE